MSRVSCDQYKLPDGTLVLVSGAERPPEGSVLWNGYDYDKQYWVYEGERDTRTLEELQAKMHGAESGCPVEMCSACFAIDNK